MNDPMILALKSMSPDEIEVLREHTTLSDAGFNDEEIEGMMKEGYEIFQRAASHLQETYWELMKEHDRKSRGCPNVQCPDMR